MRLVLGHPAQFLPVEGSAQSPREHPIAGPAETGPDSFTRVTRSLVSPPSSPVWPSPFFPCSDTTANCSPPPSHTGWPSLVSWLASCPIPGCSLCLIRCPLLLASQKKTLLTICPAKIPGSLAFPECQTHLLSASSHWSSSTRSSSTSVNGGPTLGTSEMSLPG